MKKYTPYIIAVIIVIASLSLLIFLSMKGHLTVCFFLLTIAFMLYSLMIKAKYQNQLENNTKLLDTLNDALVELGNAKANVEVLSNIISTLESREDSTDDSNVEGETN